MAAGVDFWVCAGCRSVNNLRAKQCYNCRTPRELAAVDPNSIDPSTKGGLREIALPDFQSPRPFAIAASVLILAVAGLQVISALLSTSIVLGILDGSLPAETDFLELGLVGLAAFGIGVLALIAWSTWLSVAVRAMPALGLGYPPGNGLTAFVENFLPGLNLLRVPAIVRDIIRRLEPEEGRGDVFIFVAWIGLFGGLIVPRVGAWLGFFAADTIEGEIRNGLVVQAIAVVLVLVGAIFLVALIWWIEERIQRRREAQLAGEPPPSAAAATDRTSVDFPVAAVAMTPGSTASAAPSSGPSGGVDAVGPMASGSTTPAPTAPSPGPRASLPAAPLAAAGRSSAGGAPAPIAPAPAPTPAVDHPELRRPITAVAPDLPPVSADRPGDAPAAGTPVEAGPSAEVAAAPVGPRLTIRVAGRKLTASLDDEVEESIRLDEVREAGPALARAGGTATVVVANADGAGLGAHVVDALRSLGVPTDLRTL